MSGFALLPLDCPSCGAALAAAEEDTVYYCTACRSGWRHEPTATRGLAPVDVSFVASPARAVAGHLPFWLLPAHVEITTREASGGALRGLLGFFLGDNAGGPPGDGAFAIPAFHLPIEAALEAARRYTAELPRLGELLGERLIGGIYRPEDARKLAHWVLIASQAAESDTVRELAYRIDFRAPRLLGVPWEERDGTRVDCIFGLPLGAAGERLQ